MMESRCSEGAGDNLLKNYKKEPKIVPKIPDRLLFSGILYIEGDAGHVLRFGKPVKTHYSLTHFRHTLHRLTFERPVKIHHSLTVSVYSRTFLMFERPVKIQRLCVSCLIIQRAAGAGATAPAPVFLSQAKGQK